MIFVDSSIWIDYFRRRDAALAPSLDHLLDQDSVALAAPVWIELLSGASRLDFNSLKRLLSALPIYYPTEHTWNLMAIWIGRAIDQGQRFAMGDLLIGAIAAENRSMLWSLDKDFVRMERLKFLKLFSP